MNYRVIISATAMAEIQEAFEWLANQSPLAADRWRAALLQAVDSLEALPDRYPLAPEAAHLGMEIRQLLHGRRRGIYRILFTIQDNRVLVLRVRHGARRFLGEN